jgi:hypothetical protein
MGATSSILDFFGQGTHAARPTVASLNLPANCTAIYVETDTGGVFAVVSGGWVQINPIAGTPPTIVQSGIDNNGTASITLGSPPVNGNMLVAMTFNPSTPSPGTGWTAKDGNSTGTDYGQIFTKTAGAGESATQSPLGSSPGGTGLICMWELHGQNGSTPYVAGASQAEVSAPNNVSPQFPGLANVIALAACGVVTSDTVSSMLNMTQDQIVNTGNRRGVMGHSLGSTAIAQMLTLLASSGSSKSAIALITS